MDVTLMHGKIHIEDVSNIFIKGMGSIKTMRFKIDAFTETLILTDSLQVDKKDLPVLLDYMMETKKIRRWEIADDIFSFSKVLTIERF